MNRLLSVLVIIVLVFLLASTFIPTERVITIPIRNNVQQAIAALNHPTAWRSLDSGKYTRIIEIHPMVYRLSEPAGGGDTTEFMITVIHDANPQQPTPIHLSYALPTTLFFKLAPFLQRPSIESGIMDELQGYLQDHTQ